MVTIYYVEGIIIYIDVTLCVLSPTHLGAYNKGWLDNTRLVVFLFAKTFLGQSNTDTVMCTLV